MRVVVLGTGAMGCLFAARMAPHAEVWMLGTWTEAIAAIQENGLTVDEPAGVLRIAVQAVSDPRAVPPADVALVLVKSYQTERAAHWAAECLRSDGLAVTLQNGLDNLALLAAIVTEARAAAGVTFESASLIGPGHVRHVSRGPTDVAAFPAAAAPLAALAALLVRSGFLAETSKDIEALLWSKAVINAAIHPLTALWGIANGELLATDDRLTLLQMLAEEVAEVARARGVQLPFKDPKERVQAVCRATAATHSSTLQDMARGKPTEIDSINGAVVAEGKRLGVPVPVNETVWRLLRGVAWS